MEIEDKETSIRTGVFVSYYDTDAEYLKRLKIHFAPYKLDLWDNTRIVAGTQWKEEIRQAMTRARIAILLISADYLAAEFIEENELPPLLDAAKRQGMRIVPVILRPCAFENSPLADYRPFNPSSPLSQSSRKKEEIWANLAKHVKEVLDSPLNLKVEMGIKFPTLNSQANPQNPTTQPPRKNRSFLWKATREGSVVAVLLLVIGLFSVHEGLFPPNWPPRQVIATPTPTITPVSTVTPTATVAPTATAISVPTVTLIPTATPILASSVNLASFSPYGSCTSNANGSYFDKVNQSNNGSICLAPTPVTHLDFDVYIVFTSGNGCAGIVYDAIGGDASYYDVIVCYGSSLSYNVAWKKRVSKTSSPQLIGTDQVSGVNSTGTDLHIIVKQGQMPTVLVNGNNITFKDSNGSPAKNDTDLSSGAFGIITVSLPQDNSASAWFSKLSIK